MRFRLGNTYWRPQTQRAIAEPLFDPSVSIRYAALCACRGLAYGNPPTFPEFLRRAVVAKLGDPDKVDDHRVIAKAAVRLLENYTASLP